ncbi:MAG: 50S ribosomal protein L6 [Candidatus Bathyarchaeota archaeon]|nr:MAG: 50S ribosomal protein L6 [Candidatus Bathyarchaeota archaeon]
MAATIIENNLEIPEEVVLTLEGSNVTVSGEKGQVTRDFSHTRLNIDHAGNNLKIWAVNPRKREAALVNTISAHVRNMIRGVTRGITYKMKIVFVHFPMTVRVQGRKLIIQNFIGERKNREAKIVGDVKVTVQGEDIIVEGVDIEKVAQTAANIQRATRIRRKDLRKFLDGIYVYSKE